MTYALAALTFAMLAYMFWSSTFRLRPERIRAAKHSHRNGIILTRRQRMRATLMRSFPLPRQEPQWETDLLASLRARDE
jgi:hypothetical protein